MLYRTMVTGLVLGVVTIAGCAPEGEYRPQRRPTQLAAFAASTDYPRNITRSDDLALTSTIDKQTGMITLRNFSNQALHDARLWVNESYVLPIQTLAPSSVTRIDPADVYDAAGNPLSQQRPQTIRKIEIQMGDEMLNVEGPLQE